MSCPACLARGTKTCPACSEQHPEKCMSYGCDKSRESRGLIDVLVQDCDCFCPRCIVDLCDECANRLKHRRYPLGDRFCLRHVTSYCEHNEYKHELCKFPGKLRRRIKRQIEREKRKLELLDHPPTVCLGTANLGYYTRERLCQICCQELGTHWTEWGSRYDDDEICDYCKRRGMAPPKRGTCRKCSAKFSSRNELFHHLAMTNHYV